MKPKLVYIISNYDPKTSTHYYHLHEFLELLSKSTDIFLFAESGKPRVTIKGVKKYYVQRFKFLPLKIIERFLAITWIYLNGYRRFYCHYADFTVIICSIITRLFGGTTFKWHCVQEHYYKKPLHIKHWKEKLIRELPLYISLKITQKLVTSSNAMKNYYIRHFQLDPQKIIIIPNFINIKRFTSKRVSKTKLKSKLNLPNQPILLYVHRMSHRKGADRLINIASAIKEQKLNLFIVAIGKGPLLGQLKLKVKSLGLSPFVKFIGAIPNHKLTAYYQAADIFIMPSRIEEFARVQLEAMATGLPIIATKTLASLSVLNAAQRTLVVKQGNCKEIPTIANRLLKSKTKYSTLAKAGRKRVKEFDITPISHLFMKKVINQA